MHGTPSDVGSPGLEVVNLMLGHDDIWPGVQDPLDGTSYVFFELCEHGAWRF